MIHLDPSTPVLVGVGTASEPAEASELMALAVQAAAGDAGSASLLGSIDRIAVPQGTWSYPDPGRLVAARVGSPGARTHFGQLGVSQQTLVSRALRAVESGEAEVAVVVGGDALAWTKDGGSETRQTGAVPDEFHGRDPEFFVEAEAAAGLLVPVQQYAMIDNALRHAEGRSVGQHRDEVSALWARFNTVAQDNPLAAFPEARTARDIDTPTPSNRPLAFPYNKWHASQWTVNQAAALILCSVEAARRHRVSPDRWAFPLVGIDADLAVSLSRRRDLHRWPAMEVLGRAAARRIGRPLADAEVVEVYSCFPAAVRVQQRALGLPLEATPTVTGGMSFAGGPFNNFVYQSTAAVLAAIRRAPGSLGVVTTVCGFLTKPGLAVWTTEPDGRAPLIDDLSGAASAATAEVPVLGDYRGPAVVATSTVLFDPASLMPARVVVIADTPTGERCLAVAEDRDLARTATTEELAGVAVEVTGPSFHA